MYERTPLQAHLHNDSIRKTILIFPMDGSCSEMTTAPVLSLRSYPEPDPWMVACRRILPGEMIDTLPPT